MIRIVRNIAIAAALFTSTFITGPTAGADTGDQIATQICEAISASPRAQTVAQIGLTLAEAGLNSKEVAAVVLYSVSEYCPENMDVLDLFVATYGPADATPSGAGA